MIDRELMNKVVDECINDLQAGTSSGETTLYETLALECMGISLKMIQQMANDIKDIRNAIVKEQGEPQISKRADYAEYLAEMEKKAHE